MNAYVDQWKRIERWLVYLLLVSFIAVELLSFAIPTMHSVLGERGLVVLLGLAILAAFRSIDTRLPRIRFAGGIVSKSFGEAVGRTIGLEKNLESIDIFANTSLTYYGFIRDGRIHVKKVRLLVCREGLGQHNSKETDIAIWNWQRLYAEGFVEYLNIRQYLFLPTFHFMVVNAQRGMFGLFQHPGEGTRTLRCFVAAPTDEAGYLVVEDLKMFFEIMFRDYGKEI